jgi:hypothetical protein
VDSVVSKLQETGQHVAKKSDLLFARTREAGKTFIGEVRDAGRELAVLVRTEARGWKRFLGNRSTRLRGDASAIFATRTLERELLSRVDGTLRSLDARVRERILLLERRAIKPASRKANGKRRRPRAVTAKSATSASVPASARH